MAIRQARLEPLALSVSGRERMFNGWAAASGENRMDFSAEVAWFGDILNREGVLMEIGARLILANSAAVSGSNQRGRVCAGPDPAGLAWSVSRGAWGGRIVVSSESRGSGE